MPTRNIQDGPNPKGEKLPTLNGLTIESRNKTIAIDCSIYIHHVCNCMGNNSVRKFPVYRTRSVQQHKSQIMSTLDRIRYVGHIKLDSRPSTVCLESLIGRHLDDFSPLSHPRVYLLANNESNI